MLMLAQYILVLLYESRKNHLQL